MGKTIKMFGEPVRVIEGTNGRYGVSKLGKVWNLEKGWALELIKGRYVNLGGKVYKVADLVANAWVSNPRMWRYVRHKNGDTSDNRAENLEFVATRVREYERGVGTRALAVWQMSLMGDLIAKYSSIGNASLATGVDKASISRCCNGVAVSAGGYRWRFE